MTDPSANGEKPVRYLLFSASMRSHSLNTRLIQLAARVFEKHEGIVDLAEMSEFDCPSYDQDVQTEEGFPPGAEEFRRHLEACDAFVIASPEYNASMPGNLKNMIDWVSRYTPQPFNEHHALLLSASTSMSGGNRGLWALRIPLEHLGARVFPDMFSLAVAHKAFNEAGEIADPKLAERLDVTINAFMELAKAAKNYPCPPKEWFEFVSEIVEQ